MVRTQNVFEPLKEVFEPLGVRTQLSGIRSHYQAFEPYSQSLTDLRVLKHSRLLYIHVSQDLAIYIRYMIYIHIYLRAFMVNNWFLECKIHDATHNSMLDCGRRPQSSNKSLEGVWGMEKSLEGVQSKRDGYFTGNGKSWVLASKIQRLHQSWMRQRVGCK